MASVRRSGRSWWGLVVGLWLLACGDAKQAPTPTPSVGSNSNWLKACVSDRDCSEQQDCACGTCSLNCNDDSACSILQDAQCARREDLALIASCGFEVATSLYGRCLPRCEAGTCGDGQACVEGNCVLAPIPETAFCAPVAEATQLQRTREDELLALVLAERTGGGVVCADQPPSAAVPSLRVDPRLTCAARVLAADVSAEGLAAIDRSGGGTTERLSAVGYTSALWGENFAVRAETAEAALRLMNNDVDTCQRFINPRFRDIGVGNAGNTYIVLLGVQR